MEGIFCLETYWFGDHRDKTTMLPVLELIANFEKHFEFIHHRCCTVEEFNFSILRWSLKGIKNKYPILYLAFHGNENNILIGNTKYSLDELAAYLKDKCERKIIYFGSCLTLKIDKRKLQRFLKETKALAVIGYKSEIDFLYSCSFEILLLNKLMNSDFDTRGITKFKEEMFSEYKYQSNRLDLRIEINETILYKRKRL